MKPEDEDTDTPESRRATWVVLAVSIALALGGFFLIKALNDSSNMQDCLMQGRTNCVVIDPNSDNHTSN
jgi:hypothetical protein